MVRGDTGAFSVKPKIKGENVLQEGDHLYFTLRKLKKDVDTFEEGVAEIVIETADTTNLEIGNYLYDLVMVRSDGTVDSLIPGGRDTAYFVIKKGVKQ